MCASLQKICNQEYCKNEAKNEIQRNSQKTSLGKSFPPSRKPTKSYWNISGLQVLICTFFFYFKYDLSSDEKNSSVH